ncbi:MAG: hypothetical protein IPL46_08115 [Saprospiraceae bacterium]|nr:hypothetical protein [Saprospiraceae bacterium]
MTTEEENRIFDWVVPKIFNRDTGWTRADENKWPDGIVHYEDKIFALELTELLLKHDKIHTQRKRLETFKTQLEELFVDGFRSILGDIGAFINVSADLSKERLTSSKIRILKHKIFSVICEEFDANDIRLERTRHVFEFNDLGTNVEIETSPNWTQICCNVGYKGAILYDLKTEYIQDVIDRKKTIKGGEE